jgi:hypothetical protein
MEIQICLFVFLLLLFKTFCKDVFNLAQFSECNLIILSLNSGGKSFQETDLENKFIGSNRAHFPLQVGSKAFVQQTGSKFMPTYCNIVVLISLENETFPGLERVLLKLASNYNVVISVIKKYSMLLRFQYGWESSKTTIFLLEMETNSKTGSYFYLCFYCMQLNMPVKYPSISLSDNVFHKNWKPISILVPCLNPTRYTEWSQNCKGRLTVLEDMRCQ